MSLLKSAGKLFRRSKILVIIYSLFLALSSYYALKYLFRSTDILRFDAIEQNLSLFAFVLFIFVSFEYFSLSKKSYLEECFLSSGKSYLRVLGSQLNIMLFLICIFSLIMFAVYTGYFIRSGCWALKIAAQMYLGVLLNYFVIPFSGVCFGLFFALFSNRLIAYLALVLLTLLSSTIMYDIGITVYEMTEISIFPFVKLFDFFTHDRHWVANYIFGNSILPYRWFIPLFWCCLLLSLSYIKVTVPRNLKNLSKTGLVLILAVVFLISGITPSSKIMRDTMDTNETYYSDWNYYAENADVSRNEEADFKVLEYRATLNIFTKLKASVQMLLEDNNLNEYHFTLYHSYKISKITDESGNKLDFSQSGDYVTVKSNKSLTQINMEYKGFSGTYYSNVQGVCLPAFFPYLPHSGWKPVHSGRTTDAAGFCRLYFDSSTKFNIKVNTLQHVICNLEETEKNTFSGFADGVTIAVGLYKEVSSNGITVAYPFLDSNENAQSITDYINQYKGTDWLGDSVKKIIVIPESNWSSPYNVYAAFSDHIISTRVFALESFYKDQEVAMEKHFIYEMYIGYFQKKYNFPQLSEEMPGSEFDMFYKIIEKNGEEEGLNIIKDYLYDDENKMPPMEFLAEESKNA